MPQEAFRHDELPWGHIRLIRLHKNEHEAAVHIEIFAVKHEENPRYEALSYRWDEESPRTVIHANGRPMKIMAPVHEFLVWRRSEQHEHLLWIDSLCIDQDSSNGDRERETQIPLMGVIFSKAERVLAWMGELEHAPEVKALVLSFKENSYVPFRLTAENLTDRGDQCAWEGLAQLFSRSWFTRIWVAQEVILAKELILLIGKTTIAWSQLSHVGWFVHELNFRLNGQSSLTKAAIWNHRNIAKMQSLAATPMGSCDISDLLGLTIAMEATRAHDQVFAILSLCDQQQASPLLQPRYDLPIGEVFRRATIFVLKQSSRPLSILTYVGWSIHPGDLGASWIIDFAKTRRINPFVDQSSDFAAGLHVGPRITLSESLPKTLELGGNCIDKIIKIGQAILESKNERDLMDNAILFPTMNAAMVEIDEFIVNGSRSHQHEAPSEIAWKSLLWYHAIDVFPQPDHARRMYAAFRWILKCETKTSSQLPYRSEIVFDCSDDEFAQKAQLAMQFMQHYGHRNSRIALTASGRIAMVPPLTRAGDHVCIIWGANMPHILRPVVETSTGRESYSLMGFTYILDYMWGDFGNEDSGQMFSIM